MLIIDASPRSSTAILSPQACAVQLASKLNFWYSADNLTVINGLVAQATDLTGNNRNGVQNTDSLRLTYFASDPLFGGKPSFGSTTSSGQRRLNCSSGSLSYRHQIFSCYYLGGTQATWLTNACLSSGNNGASGEPRIRARQVGANTLQTGTEPTALFSSTLSSGGRTQSTIVLPMPASVYTATALANVSTFLAIGSNQGSGITTQQFPGAFRHFVGANQLLTAQEIQLIEGVIAWDDGTQGSLISTHPYFNWN